MGGPEPESEEFSLPVVLKINVVKLIGRRWGLTALTLVLFFPKGKRNKSVKGEVYRYWLGWKDGWPIRCGSPICLAAYRVQIQTSLKIKNQ
jgi:hypothetical protein